MQIKCSLVRRRLGLNISCLFQVNRVLFIFSGWECGLECNFGSGKANSLRRSHYIKWIPGFIIVQYSVQTFIHTKLGKRKYKQGIDYESLYSLTQRLLCLLIMYFRTYEKMVFVILCDRNVQILSDLDCSTRWFEYAHSLNQCLVILQTITEFSDSLKVWSTWLHLLDTFSLFKMSDQCVFPVRTKVF